MHEDKGLAFHKQMKSYYQKSCFNRSSRNVECVLRALDDHNKGKLEHFREKDSEKNATKQALEEKSIEAASSINTNVSTVKPDTGESEIKKTNDQMSIDMMFSKLRQLMNEYTRSETRNERKIKCDGAKTSPLDLVPENTCLDNRLFEIVSLLESEEDGLEVNGKDLAGKEDLDSNDYLIARRLLTSLGYCEHHKNGVQRSLHHQIDVLGKIMGTSFIDDGLTLSFDPDEFIPITQYGLAAIMYVTEKTLNKMCQMADTSVGSSKNVSPESSLPTADILDESNAISSDSQPKTSISKKVKSESQRITLSLKCDHPFRSGLFAALLNCGLPFRCGGAEISSPIQSALITDSDASFFGTSHLINMANQLVDSEHLPSISAEDVESYIMDVLLPHCISVSLFCRGATMQQNYNSCNSLSKNKEIFFFPDPLQPLSKHSVDAVVNAYTLLRRCSLLNSIHSLVRGAIPKDDIHNFLRSEGMRQNDHGIPCWWCPWIHDIGLLVHAAKFGLFTIIQDRKLSDEQLNKSESVFGSNLLEKHVESLFIKGQDGSPPFLPQKVIAQAPPSELKSLIKSQTSHFPSATDIECRLSFICGELSRMHGKEEDSWFYVDLPMYDHVRWPMTFSTM